MKVKPDNRLLAVASCVSEGAFLADVGTDHAYLPIYLAECGKIKKAVASDIHKGPIESAKKNIAENGFSDCIETVLTDGLAGLDIYPLTDIVIAGMGGLMIKGILENAPFVKKRKIKLILQPMQHIPELRAHLASEGFTVTKEVQAEAEHKFYQVICAVYTGKKEILSETELLLGRYNMEHKTENTENYRKLCHRHLDILRVKIDGLQRGNLDASSEKALYDSIEKELHSIEK